MNAIALRPQAPDDAEIAPPWSETTEWGIARIREQDPQLAGRIEGAFIAMIRLQAGVMTLKVPQS